MKKILCLCLFFIGCSSFQTHQPSVSVDNHRFVLTSAYTGPDGIVNIYTASDFPGTELNISSAPTLSPELSQMVLNMVLPLFQALSLPQEDYQISSAEENGLFSSSVDFITQNPSERSYSVSLKQDGKDKTTRMVSFKTPLSADQTRAQAYQRFLPDLQKLMSLPLYPTRPGHKHPDDSPDLQKLKTFLAKEYHPQTKITQQGRITSMDTVDNNQIQAFELISNSREPDVSAWLENNIANYSPKFLYAMMIRAAQLQKPTEDILFWMMAARLRAGSDAALCQDRFVSQYLTVMAMEFIPQIQPYISQEEWKTFLNDPQTKDRIFNKVWEWDKKHPQKNSPEWFCNSGHAVRTSQSHPQKEWKKRRKQYRKEFFENRQKNSSKTTNSK